MLLVAEPHGTPKHPVQEPEEAGSSAPVHTDIQLLPQQAGMASILATAVINSEYATPWGRLWVTLSQRAGQVLGVSIQEVQFTHTHTLQMNSAPVRH